MRKTTFLLLVFAAIISYAQNSNSENLIDQALLKAKKENKQVFINYLTTNSELSDKMRRQMNNDEFQSLFSSNYVVVNLTIPQEETSEYVNCSNPVKSFGEVKCEKIAFPFWSILDNQGNPIAVSYKENEKIGYPSSAEAIQRFVEVLEETSHISEEKLNRIADSFLENKNDKLYTIR